MLSCSVQMLFYLYAYMLVCVVPEGPAKTPTGCFQALWTGSQESESVSTADSPVGREATGQAALGVAAEGTTKMHSNKSAPHWSY